MNYITLPWAAKSRFDKIASWGSWLLLLTSLASIVFDLDSRVLLAAVIVWIPIITVATVRDELRLRREMKKFTTNIEFLDRVISAKRKEDLSPEDQEELNIFTARHLLKEPE